MWNTILCGMIYGQRTLPSLTASSSPPPPPSLYHRSPSNHIWLIKVGWFWFIFALYILILLVLQDTLPHDQRVEILSEIRVYWYKTLRGQRQVGSRDTRVRGYKSENQRSEYKARTQVTAIRTWQRRASEWSPQQQRTTHSHETTHKRGSVHTGRFRATSQHRLHSIHCI